MADRQTFKPTRQARAAADNVARQELDTRQTGRSTCNPLYASARWRRARAGFLRHNPLCVLCQRDGRTKAATVVDHVRPWRRIRLDYDASTIIVCGPNGSGKSSFCREHREPDDLVFDADDVAQSIGFIKQKRAGDIMQLVTAWRNALIDHIISARIQRRCFIIVARRADAESIQRDTGGQLVDLGDDNASNDMETFWDTGNWQALCASCHSRKTVVYDGGFGRRNQRGSNV